MSNTPSVGVHPHALLAGRLGALGATHLFPDGPQAAHARLRALPRMSATPLEFLGPLLDRQALAFAAASAPLSRAGVAAVLLRLEHSARFHERSPGGSESVRFREAADWDA